MFFFSLRLRLQEHSPRAPLLPWRPKAASLGQPLQGPGLRRRPAHPGDRGCRRCVCGLGGPRVLASNPREPGAPLRASARRTSLRVLAPTRGRGVSSAEPEMTCSGGRRRAPGAPPCGRRPIAERGRQRDHRPGRVRRFAPPHERAAQIAGDAAAAEITITSDKQTRKIPLLATGLRCISVAMRAR